jgi:uncharacterized membrane protein YphA (DoxX/SURF4 family)
MADVAVQPIHDTAPAPAPERWPLARRLAFRFFCCYWLLYALPESGRVSLVPEAEFLFKWWEKMWHALVPWVATRIFHVTGQPATYFPTGSGDTTLQYVTNLLYVVVSLAAMLVWSALDRRRPNYRALDAWLRVLVRYTLAFTLFGYGFAKIFPLQFQPTPLRRLIEPYGDFSPMGVLWSFMGASVPYIVFSGIAEALGGVLLLFRRTTSLGAMVSFAVMLNVAVLNYCYDVPVKLYSTNLTLMAVFLLTPDLRRLFDVLVRNRAAEPADLNPVVFRRRWMRIAAMVCWIGVVGYHLYSNIYGGWQGYKRVYRNPQRSPYYGIYDVESGAAWSKVAIQFPAAIMVRKPDDSMQSYPTKDARWSTPDPDRLVLEGTFDGAPATVRLRKTDAAKYPLPNRGFRWINEFPFNR